MKRNLLFAIVTWFTFASCTNPIINSFTDADFRQAQITNPTSPTQDTVPTRDDNMLLGNPSKAKNGDDHNNYLIKRDQYALSYNKSKGGPNWVSWHLSPAWKGGTNRTKTFRADTILVRLGIDTITTNHYTNSGFDRGHQCPAEDRDASLQDMNSTFFMSNILPQAPSVNQQIWKDLESYCRDLADEGYELYVICGGYGSGGILTFEDKPNELITTISNRINVPSNLWKVVVVLPLGSNDIKRIDNKTRVIAINIPNDENVAKHSWADYRTTVDALEKETKYDFLSVLSKKIQKNIESKKDTITIN